ncbi:tripartite motif-containing protein 16-like [Embiotoca jacksoni]|uniref:tripartite motif-containing protein 16-like n=1 Tax=Embiotoca jacksoni TaxID=100190 RepID=UPI0037046A0A
MSDQIEKDPQITLCDMCPETDRKPAKKTCMKCEISMCVQHLQAHLTTPVFLQTHPLTEPMALCGTTKCPEHGKMLEYYCLDDMTCVCVSCAIEDQHRLHNMKTFSTARKDLVEKLEVEQKALLVKTDDKNVSLEKWEKSEREKLQGCSLRLIEAVTNLRDISLTSVQSSVSARMVSIKTSKRSMQAAQDEKDTFRFLQMYSQVQQDVEKAKAVDLRKGLEPGSDQDKLVQEIIQGGEKIMQQAGQFWGSLLTLVDPEDHQELVPSPDLFLDPEIFGPGMSLSKDNRKVFHQSWMGQCCGTLLISSTLAGADIQRWTVRLSKESDWTIGLWSKCSASTEKDGPVYGLCCEDNQISCLKNSTRKKLQREKGDEAVPRPEMVEVFWNFPTSKLSFYSRTGQHQRKEILTIQVSPNKRDLVPFVQLGKEDAHKSSQKEMQLQQQRQQQRWQQRQLQLEQQQLGQLEQQQLEQQQQQQQQLQQQYWGCTCGEQYNKDVYGFWQHHSNNSPLAKCSCGEMIGGRRTTEMVCELC